MGTFIVEPRFRNPNDRSHDQVVPVLVDTGATWTTLPEQIVERLGCQALSTRRIRFADGREETWPITIVLVTLDDHELPTICLIGPRGGPALLGAVTLEEFSLSVDPVARRLVPVTGYLTAAAIEVRSLIGHRRGARGGWPPRSAPGPATRPSPAAG
jgi:clan AA aspartic protease